MNARWVGVLTVTGSLLLSPTPCCAQDYPARPIRLIVAQAPGGSTDLVARAVGQKLAEAWGQQVVIDNRAGAGGSVGTEIVARAAPDGYTLQMATVATHGVIPALRRKLAYDPVKDFAPVTLAATTPNALIVHPSLPARSVKELIELAKAKPGQLNYASSGTSGAQHLACEYFQSMAGKIATVHVPYKGTTPALNALIAGEVAWMMPALSSALPQMRTHRIRGLAVTSRERVEEMPELPTVAETLPGFEAASWFGLVAPAATPRAIVSRLNAEVTRALATPEMKKSFTAAGLTAAPNTPEQFQAMIRTDYAKWAKVVKEANIPLE